MVVDFSSIVYTVENICHVQYHVKITKLDNNNYFCRTDIYFYLPESIEMVWARRKNG